MIYKNVCIFYIEEHKAELSDVFTLSLINYQNIESYQLDESNALYILYYSVFSSYFCDRAAMEKLQ